MMRRAMIGWAAAAMGVVALAAAPAWSQDEPAGGDGAMAQRVADEAAKIQAEPPIHERENPWTVPLREFELEIQPLQTEPLQARLGIWTDLLQTKIRERNRVTIAQDRAAGGGDGALQTALSDAAAEYQGQIAAITARIRAMLGVLAERGVDVSEHEGYLATATGQKLNWTNPEVLGTQALSWLRSPSGGVAAAISFAAFLGILIAFWILSRILGAAVAAALRRVNQSTSDMLRRVLVQMTRRTVLIIGLVVAVGQLGVNVTPLVAAIGAAGLVIGLALQGTLSNFASGILILMNRPYDVGDVVSAGGITGKVEAMSLVNTRICTFDNQVMYVPNNSIWNGVITNITGRDTRRVDLVFGIGYGDDIAVAESIIAESVAAHPKVLKDPAPTIKVHELADSSVNFVVRPWSTTSDYWDVYWDLTRTVKERFDEAGVGIPFPQRDLHIPGEVKVVLSDRASIEAKPTTNTTSAP